MADFERVAAAVNLLAKVCGDVLYELTEWTWQTANELLETIDLEPLNRMNQAYRQARQEHPEWVHRVQYSKRKRIRKKYHDRIMRKYGGESGCPVICAITHG